MLLSVIAATLLPLASGEKQKGGRVTRPSVPQVARPELWINRTALREVYATKQWELSTPAHVLCTEGNYNPLCTAVIVLTRQRVTFCSAAKIASTTIRSFFLKVADGDVAVPAKAMYPVHQANWTFLQQVPITLREQLSGPWPATNWMQVNFVRNVIVRFVSGYLDKIVHDCGRDYNGTVPQLVKQHYTRLHGFSCAEHSGFREFVGFVERLGQDKLEGHFLEQTSVCDLRYPFTDLVLVAEGELDTSLSRLGSRLGFSGTVPSIRNHRTGSNSKLADMFRGRNKDLLYRLLRLFEKDCKLLPALCDVDDLIRAISSEQMGTKPAKVAHRPSSPTKAAKPGRFPDTEDLSAKRSSLRGRTKVAKVASPRARVKSAKVPPTPYV